MDLREVDRRWGALGAKWVWSAQPRFLFDEDGNDALPPVNEVTEADYSDEDGWWTCDPKTRTNDLAVIYRSAGKGDFPVVGPKDLCQVMLATSDAFPLADDPFAGQFSKHHGCRCVAVGRFAPPIGLAQLREEFQDTWPALRAGFVKAAMPLPNEVWDRLLDLEPTVGSETAALRVRPALVAGERRDLERRLEDWLEANPGALARIGLEVQFEGRQVLCSPDHEGTIDLLFTHVGRPGSFVAVELKVEEVRRDAIAQALGYVGWLRSRPEVARASAIVIGCGQHRQVPFVLQAVGDDSVRYVSWTELGLPVELARELGIA